MASKIFMDDMPELTEKILNNLNNDFYSLYSCALVNRHWCKISIPILWQDPFSIDRSSLFISQYFSSLDKNEKFILKEYGINTVFPNTLFNYARFLKVLDLFILEKKIEKWIDFQPVDSKSYYIPSIHFLINLLLKLFVESGATLHKFILYFSDYGISPEIFYSLGRNDLFFSRLQDLSLGPIPDSTENVIVLLKILAKNATKISALKLEEFYCDYEPQLLYALICIIESQEQLQQFSLVGGEGFTIEFHSIISALESQKNSLQKVVIECCAFTTEFKVLSDCKNLEYFHVRYCGDVKIFETSLNTLEITDCSVTTSNIIQILQKSGSLLQRLKLESTYEVYLKKSLLLEALKSFCPNITYLDIPCIILSTQLVELIGDLQKLQFLTLWHINCIPEDPKIGVLKFAKVLPSTLQYLDLRYSCLNSYIDILLNNCNAPLKNLLINHINNEKTTKTLVEFCIRKRSLNYVGVEEYLNLDDSIIKKLEGYVTLMPCECIVVNC